jgi:hypothetical protein
VRVGRGLGGVRGEQRAPLRDDGGDREREADEED